LAEARHQEIGLNHAHWLKDVLVFLAAAGLIVPLFHRARIGAVLAFLVIGVVIGPYGLGRLATDMPWIRYLTIEDRAQVEPFAELGVMFLLFLIGLEMSVARLWALRRFVAGIGGLQFIATALMLAGAILLAGGDGRGVIVLGLCLAMSSTAIVMQLLEEQGRSATAMGQIALSILLFQDLMVAPVLFGTQVLARGGDNIWLALALALLQAAGAIALILLAGRYLLRPMFRFAAKTGSRELIMAITLLLVVGVAGATGYAGLSTALGAFLAGLLLSETEYRHQVEIDLAPFKGLLIGLFFITVGMSVDVRVVWEEIARVAFAVLVLVAVKGLILFAACRLLGVSLATAVEVAVLLMQAGEFGFVVIWLAYSGNLLSLATAQLATAVVALSMLLTPIFALAGRWLGHRLQRVEHRRHMPAASDTQLTDHVIIGGFGRVGQAMARLLDAENISYVAFDTNGQLVSQQRKAGQRVYFGDAARVEFLRRAGAARVRAFVVTVNSADAAERMVAAARKISAGTPIYARAVDAEHAARLLRLGAVDVIPEAVEASLQLGGRLLEGLGLPDDAVARRLELTREEEQGRLAGSGAGA
jgi:CPA2 family monovalent cation:H+ antiporter-2